MLKHLLLTIVSLLAINVMLFSQTGSIQGKVLDVETNEPIPFANVAIFSGGSLLTGATTDFDGKYAVRSLRPGSYSVRASFIGYQTKEVAGAVLLVVIVECAEVIARHKGGGSIGGGGLCDQGTCLRNCCELTEAFSAIEGNMTSRVAKGAA